MSLFGVYGVAQILQCLGYTGVGRLFDGLGWKVFWGNFSVYSIRRAYTQQEEYLTTGL
ncbi:hypothetical protein TRIATDRAFT_300633 [Trichoderma atroviride IMI 206040]|uniref:Uncharacterized protein n=1 Tax=Hypocrea atroviridis (strain ATCC 20476 / IMI 206040) TaxID=452589 RepID=G9NY77_HYPAI|nr:uncharacterized protein TRIATDRAFT_300633 [Trichoderma atroviride IMI 206040]EHK44403.1 hypothetical protein TRIATDRAFT_300633 [Trichoderma atroviride IMI 206040]